MFVVDKGDGSEQFIVSVHLQFQRNGKMKELC
jgi:hypothetical protein